MQQQHDFSTNLTLPHQPVPPLPQPRKRILVVDDEKPLAWTLGRILALVGYEVKTFNDPCLVLEEFRQRPADLVLSDVLMPEMSGIDLAISLQQHKPDCKIVLLSGQAATVHLLANAKAKGYDFEVFPKPFAPKDLLRHVGNLIGEPMQVSSE